MMTPQEVFDMVAVHLIVQGRRSVSDERFRFSSGQCAYRGNDGCKCAAGVLIDDDHYDERMEGYSVGDFRIIVAVNATIGIPLDPFTGIAQWELINSLQNCHDAVEPMRWQSKLRYIARGHNLDDTATWAPV